MSLRSASTTVRVLFANLVDNALRYTPSGGQVDVCLLSLDGACVEHDVIGDAVEQELAEVDGCRTRLGTVVEPGETEPEDEVRVLFANLVDNALRYTPSGGQVDVCLLSLDASVFNRQAEIIALRDAAGDGEPEPRAFDIRWRGLRYTPSGGQVDVCLLSLDGACVVTVRDTGCGLPTT
jgi:signal transduction histidine kinase